MTLGGVRETSLEDALQEGGLFKMFLRFHVWDMLDYVSSLERNDIVLNRNDHIYNIYHREMRYHDLVPGISFGISVQVLVSGRWLTSYVACCTGSHEPRRASDATEVWKAEKFATFRMVFFVCSEGFWKSACLNILCAYIYILLSISHNCP